MAEATPSRRKVADYKSNVKPIWCPGCGDYAVLSAFMKAIAELDIPPEKVAIASGIGCSGRFPAFVRAYGLHGTHGRALPLATGIKLGNPDLTVFAIGGDGDAFSIGAGHLPHAARRNVNLTYIVLDNQIYALTKGQPSPTSPEGMKRKASPFGTIERHISPTPIMLAYGATFVARGFSANPRQITDLIIQAVANRGFSFLHIISPCVSFYDTYAYFKERLEQVPDTHDVTDLHAAIHMAFDPDHLYCGVFYQVERPTFLDGLDAIREETGALDLEKLVDKYCVSG
jgi:2-oxoglutarate ferredoxin oxidoreductase subunit beta